MQSITVRGRRILAWEHVELPNEVYRVQNVRWITEPPPNLGEWLDLSDNDLFQYNLDIALGILGEKRTGAWDGAANPIGNVCHGVAWMRDSN